MMPTEQLTNCEWIGMFYGLVESLDMKYLNYTHNYYGKDACKGLYT